MKFYRLAMILFALLLPLLASAKGGKATHHTSSPRISHRASTSSHLCTTCVRDSKGKIKRSRSATQDFKKNNPCPSTGKRSGACPGYVVDHVQALKHGGSDSPSNMQWQTKDAAKAKDKFE